MEETLTKVAKEILGLETLETRGQDSLDFHDLAVWNIQQALVEAYNCGRSYGTAAAFKSMYENNGS